MDVMSQKTTLPVLGFDASLHFIPQAVLKRFMSDDLKHHLVQNLDIDIRLRDYKPSSFIHKVNNQRDFYGRIYPLKVDEVPAKFGVISMIPAYAIFDQTFVPGMYHNLCSPMFEVAMDRDNVAKLMTEFKDVMYAVLDTSKQKNTEAKLSKSHIRHDLFSKNILYEIDSR
jgi:hypothetical protein